MNSDIAIEIRGLTKRYKGGVLANDGLDLEVPRGIVFALLGPNGAGKTTLVRQITGELAPTSGEIRVLDVDVLRKPLRAKSLMGVVPQEASPYPHLTPKEHLVLFGRLHGLSRQQANQRAVELMTALGLQNHEKKVAEQLSGGLKRKLLVANALIAQPPILILDEPTTGLDPHSRREVWALMRSLRSQGTTILITTHYMDEAENLSDLVAVISAGRILTQGTVEEIRARSRNRYKATFGNNGDQRAVYGETHAGTAIDGVLSGAGGFYDEIGILALITAVTLTLGIVGMRWREV